MSARLFWIKGVTVLPNGESSCAFCLLVTISPIVIRKAVRSKNNTQMVSSLICVKHLIKSGSKTLLTWIHGNQIRTSIPISKEYFFRFPIYWSHCGSLCNKINAHSHIKSISALDNHCFPPWSSRRPQSGNWVFWIL